MDAELTALVTAGATTLVQQMATDAWARTRDRVAAFLARRSSADPAAVAAELDAARAELATARQDGDEETAADVQGDGGCGCAARCWPTRRPQWNCAR